MTKFLVLLGLCVTVVLSSPLPSESQERFRFVPWLAFNEESRPVHEPGSLIVVEISRFQFRFCFAEMPGGEDCLTTAPPEIRKESGLPPGTQLISLRETVASVEFIEFVGRTEPVIRLNRPGNTTLQLRATDEKKRILAAYRLIVSPVDAGTACDSFFLAAGSSITDCSGRCFPIIDCPSGGSGCVSISERIGDNMCNSGRLLDDGRRDINLACSTFAFDGGDCVVGEDPSLVIKDCCGCTIESFERIRQALNDGMCNDVRQDINLNCDAFASDRGACTVLPEPCPPCRR
jgi:hypothetical protein